MVVMWEGSWRWRAFLPPPPDCEAAACCSLRSFPSYVKLLSCAIPAIHAVVLHAPVCVPFIRLLQAAVRLLLRSCLLNEERPDSAAECTPCAPSFYRWSVEGLQLGREDFEGYDVSDADEVRAWEEGHSWCAACPRCK